MRISRISARSVLAAALVALPFGLAPAAAAQDLVPVQGAPIAYRVSLPGPGWETSNENGSLTVGREDVMIIVSATDLVSLQQRPQTVSEAQYRSILTQRFMASDSVMMALMTRVVANARSLEQGLVKEVRTLGGQRAAYIRERQAQSNGEPRWHQAYLTVKDGVV